MRTASSIGFIIVAAVLFFSPTEAAGCCTDFTCPYCSSSGPACTSDCSRCENTGLCPTCNFVGCNCNAPCRCYSNTGSQCVPGPCCGDADAERAAARARFDEIDTSRDGKIRPGELRAWVRKTFGRDWMDRVPDRGKRGERQVLKRQFDQMDANDDGAIVPRNWIRRYAELVEPAPEIAQRLLDVPLTCPRNPRGACR